MRILILSYHLLPDQTAEGLCVAKAARALADRGHHIEILTSAAAVHSMLEGIPIHHVPLNATSGPWVLRLLRALNSHARKPSPAMWLWSRIDAAANIMLGCTADDYAWSSAAADKAVSLLRKRNKETFDLVYSRLNHFRSHLAMLRVTRRMPEVPWCAHFSDPWPGHLYPEGYKFPATQSGLMEKRSESTLNRILERADSLTFPAERLMRFILADPRKKYLAKGHVVPHLGHFQKPKSHDRTVAKVEGIFTIVFTGFLLRQRHPGIFLRALRRFLDCTPATQGKVKVLFVGRNMPLVEDDINALDLHDVVSALPYSNPDEVWPLMCEADVLLLLESQMQEGVFMPSKLADYLSARRPILALSPEVGTVTDYLSEGGGLRVDPDDEDAILHALQTLFECWQSGHLEDFAPPESLVSRILPEKVVPLYEVAFQEAITAARHRSAPVSLPEPGR